MIELHDINYAYRKRPPALRGVNANFAAGKLHGLYGPNGCGKSTLLKIITGELTPDSGQAKPKFGSPLERARRLALVEQNTPTALPLTVREVVALGRYPWRRDAAPTEIVSQVLAWLQLAPLADCRYAQISGGEQQRVMLARALAQDTEILLLDEPSSALDFGHQQNFYQLLRQLAEQGRCVIMVTHDLFQAPQFLHQAWLMNKGQIIAAGNPEKVLEKNNLNLVYAVGKEAACRG